MVGPDGVDGLGFTPGRNNKPQATNNTALALYSLNHFETTPGFWNPQFWAPLAFDSEGRVGKVAWVNQFQIDVA